MKQILFYFILFVIYVQHVQNILRTKPIFMTQRYKNKNKKHIIRNNWVHF